MSRGWWKHDQVSMIAVKSITVAEARRAVPFVRGQTYFPQRDQLYYVWADAGRRGTTIPEYRHYPDKRSASPMLVTCWCERSMVMVPLVLVAAAACCWVGAATTTYGLAVMVHPVSRESRMAGAVLAATGMALTGVAVWLAWLVL